jgi:uncharacterized protein
MTSSSGKIASSAACSGINKAAGKAVPAPFAHVRRIADDGLARFDMYTDTLLVHRAMQP